MNNSITPFIICKYIHIYVISIFCKYVCKYYCNCVIYFLFKVMIDKCFSNIQPVIKCQISCGLLYYWIWFKCATRSRSCRDVSLDLCAPCAESPCRPIGLTSFRQTHPQWLCIHHHFTSVSNLIYLHRYHQRQHYHHQAVKTTPLFQFVNAVVNPFLHGHSVK